MLVRNTCRRGVDTASPGESVRIAAERMHQRSVGTLVVVEGGKPTGIVTDRDLAMRVVAAGRDADSTRIDEIMSPAPTTVRETRTLHEALAVMVEEPARRLPVVDDSGALVGILSIDDVLLALTAELGRLSSVVERELPRAVAGP